MGITAMIPDATMGQLFDEAEQRWGEIWDVNATRMRILMLCPRKDRKMMELHGDLVEHGQPIVSIFHRPREQAKLIEEQGLNPRDASFQFVDLATTDLGPWVQHLIKGEGWKRSSIKVHPLPFSIDSPAQRAFEAEQIMCFTHPDINPIEIYYLPFPTSSLPGKAFVSLPRRQAAEFARQQAEVLGVGRLERPKPEITEEPEPVVEEDIKEESNDEPVEEIQTEEVETPEVEPPEVEETTEDVEQVPLPPSTANEEKKDEAKEIAVNDEVVVETSTEPTLEVEESDSTEAELPQEEESEPQSEIEIEFRAFIQEKIDSGIEVSEFMEDPRWEEMNERAIAIQLDTWSILVEMTSIG
jgi:hypothetical protein